MRLSLFNSLTRKKESFIPADKKLIKVYVCGPTVYARPHIGNARSVVVYDLLYRLLIILYSKENVKYVRNITDIDDKIIDKAKKDNISIKKLTTESTRLFHKDMEHLKCLKPTFEPKATEHVDDMIYIISKLLQKKIAYQLNGHIYFDISKTKNYEKLSGRKLNDMISGVRISNSDDKKNPGDFVLWKPATNHIARFDSPFGPGRPGWHIECSAMSYKYLGKDFDIHGGGIDLIFPHHSNEIAQSCSAFENSTFAKYWIHNGLLTINGEKMAKSTGNIITVKDLAEKGVSGVVLRLFLLSNHYKKPLDFNDRIISNLTKMISYWYRAIEDIEDKYSYNQNHLSKDFLDALLDDMNSSKAIKIMNQFAKLAYDEKKIEYKRILFSSLYFMGLIDGSIQAWLKRGSNDDEIKELIDTRILAKKKKNWELADNIRIRLREMNIVIEDQSDGTTKWTRER